MRYLLFKFTQPGTFHHTIDKNLIVKEFSPSPTKLYAEWETCKDMATGIFRFYISILTCCKTKYLCLIDNNGVIRHFAYVIPRNIKYAFLKEGEYSIGPCNTPEEYRGQGLYPYMLSYITNSNLEAEYYVFIRDDNIASIKGATKAGFVQLKNMCVIKTKLLKRFKLHISNM